jgi:hypothetical protein
MKRIYLLLIVISLTLILFSGCSAGVTSSSIPTVTSSSSATTGPGGGLIVQSDSLDTGKIAAIRQQTTGYPWEMDLLIQSSTDVGSLPNPTKDSVGKVITVKTDQDLSQFKAGEIITARIKYVGDVPKPGITLYIYNIIPEASP